jgi:hypothetical protein
LTTESLTKLESFTEEDSNEISVHESQELWPLTQKFPAHATPHPSAPGTPVRPCNPHATKVVTPGGAY